MATADEYPPEWPQVSLATKIEAGFRCVRCGHPNGRFVPTGTDPVAAARLIDAHDPCASDALTNRWRFYEVEGGVWIRSHLVPCDRHCTHDPDVQDHRVLTVHHLDGDKHNLAWWNLMAACQRCHLEIQGRVKMDQAYLHPHTEWFRPYVAGYYASVVLGLVLSRQEVEDRMRELLAAGQPHLEEHYRMERQHEHPDHRDGPPGGP